jgi:hypothetical protein
MRYKPKGVAALQMILGGFPDTMRVEMDDKTSAYRQRQSASFAS